jgi:formylglycine-generating enzyme required for sulfatase activity
VRIARRFAAGATHVTVEQFAAFIGEAGYAASSRCITGLGQTAGSWRNPGFAQDGSHPAVCIDWADAKAYAEWLTGKTGRPYRLLTEAEWEYAARGRTAPGLYPRMWSGSDEIALCRYGNGLDQQAPDLLRRGLFFGIMPCRDGYQYTSPAGHYAPNAFGLYDMFGNARQWTADCWHTSYAGAPSDGAAWASPGPCAHVVRGGAWSTIMRELRSASRYAGNAVDNTYGFRVARTLAMVDGVAAEENSHDAGDDAVVQGWAGVRTRTVTPKNMDAFGVREPRGAGVVDVMRGSPAAHAGLDAGDVIVAVNGRDTADSRTFAQLIHAVSPGDTVRLTVIRGGQVRTVRMTAGARPEQR